MRKGNGDKYIDMRVLYNEEGTGYTQQMIIRNLETYKREKAVRDAESDNHTK